jgi:hypothetical protein
MPRTWRRRYGKDAWHFCTNCKEWPTETGNYVEKKEKPVLSSGEEFCDQCLGKEKAQDCKD